MTFGTIPSRWRMLAPSAGAYALRAKPGSLNRSAWEAIELVLTVPKMRVQVGNRAAFHQLDLPRGWLPPTSRKIAAPQN